MIMTKNPETSFAGLLYDFSFVKSNKRIEFANIPCSFDIETTSFYRRKDDYSITCLKPKDEDYFDYEKCACMYAFVIGIDGRTFVARTWCEALICFQCLTSKYNLNGNRRMVFYVHNLDFEFNFFRGLFHWDKVFAIDKRRPMYALTDGGIEFRCSYLLTGYGLEKVGEHLLKYRVSKLMGDLDYELFRHSWTPLTSRELGYIVNDARVVMSHIQEEIERLGDITKLPYTQTGYVRNYARKEALYNGDTSHRKCFVAYRHYRDLMRNLTLTISEYEQAKRAFAGGFTHASPLYSKRLSVNVWSFDFKSAYPAVMVMEKFPMSKGKKVKITSYKQAMKLMDEYCCMFDCYFDSIESKVDFEHFISSSKCFRLDGETLDNGRVVSAESLAITLTEQDYMVVEKCYSFESVAFGDFRIYRRGYLPTEFVRAVLKLYKDKTTLKGVEGKEAEYTHSKHDLNALFGMCCTDIIREEQSYSNEEGWIIVQPDRKAQIEKYNKSKSRFLSYLWGVWITAYNRANLWTAIITAGDTYVYSDTDSVKVRFGDRLMPYIEWYNNQVIEKLKAACRYHGFPMSLVSPKNIKGQTQTIGQWDFEGIYDEFKSLGAKRYMVRVGDKYNLTVAGVSKVKAMPYILKQAKEKGCSPFDLFDDELFIPEEYAGKMLHTYIDEPRQGILVDYQGNPGRYNEDTCIHLEKTSYSLSMSDMYINYLNMVRVDSELI